MLLPFVIAQLT